MHVCLWYIVFFQPRLEEALLDFNPQPQGNGLKAQHFQVREREQATFLQDSDLITKQIFHKAIMEELVQAKPFLREYLFRKSCELIQRQIREQSKIAIPLSIQEKSEEFIEIHNHLMEHINEVLEASVIPQRQVKVLIIIINGLGPLQQFYLGLNIFKRIFEAYHKLQFVVLQDCNIGDDAITIIKQCKLAYLQKLQLNMNRLSKKGMKILAGCTLQSLEDLNLGFNNIGNSGISYLAKANWPALKYFIMPECNATVEAYRLIQKANWPKLQTTSIQCGKKDLYCAASLKRFAKQYTPLAVLRQKDSPPLSRWNVEFLKLSEKTMIVFSKK